MQRRNTSAHRHHHRHHHHSRRLQADSNETPGIDEEAERERLPKKEKRVYRSSLRTHKSHRRQDDTDAGATRSDPDAHSQIKYTGKGSAEDDTVVSHPYNSSQTHRQAVEEKRTRTSDSLKVSTEGSAAKRTPMSDAKRSSPQALLLKMFRPAASMSERRQTRMFTQAMSRLPEADIHPLYYRPAAYATTVLHIRPHTPKARRKAVRLQVQVEVE
ncbi:hypothetical protein McaMca56_003043 [Microsporum canis]